MEKEFVPYAESLALKELGFDEPTLYHWHSSCKTHPFTNEICDPNCRPKTNSGIKSIGEENHVWSAPTFSQAFRFFREFRDYDDWPIESWIQPYLSDEPRQHEAFYWRRGETVSIGIFSTHEEAELACLRKLIELVKQKP